MANVAVMEPALVVTLLTVIPVGALIVAPDRFDPAIVTPTVPPCVPLFGVIDVSDGGAPCWEIVTVRPPMVRVPLRAPPVLAATE